MIRMLPVAISLLGARMDWSTMFFIGWFGPRGLASIIFAIAGRPARRAWTNRRRGRNDWPDGPAQCSFHGLSAQLLAGRYAATHPRRFGARPIPGADAASLISPSRNPSDRLQRNESTPN